MNHFLEVKNLNKYYSNQQLVVVGLKNINLSFDLGEFVAITGASGSGKTTLLNVLSGMDTYNDGEFHVDGKNVNTFTPLDYEHYRQNEVRFIFQNYNLIDSYTVYQNIEIAFVHSTLTKTAKKQKILSILKEVELENKINEKVTKLSGGERQRVSIARAIASDAKILACDEPTGNLDSVNSKKIVELLKKVGKDKLVLYVTHDIEEVEGVATRILKIHDGEIILDQKKDLPVQAVEVTPVLDSNVGKEKAFREGIRLLWSTPKKLCLFFLIFFVATAIVGLCYQFLFHVSMKDSESYNTGFMNRYDTRVIVKNPDFAPFTTEQMEKLQNISKVNGIVKNDFGLDHSFSFTSASYNEKIFPLLTSQVDKSQLKMGRLPEKDNEIVFQNNPNSQTAMESKDLLGKSLTFVCVTNQKKYSFTIVGIVEAPMKNFYVTENMLEQFGNDLLISSTTIKKALEALPADTRIETDDSLAEDEMMITYYKRYYYGSGTQTEISQVSIESPYYSIVVPKMKSTIETKREDSRNSCVVKISSKLLEPYQDSIYEITLNCKSVDYVDDVSKIVESMGLLDYTILSTKQDNSGITQFYLRIIQIIACFILLSLVVLFTYLSLRNILASEVKSFQTLRAMGYSQKGITKILISQLGSILGLCYVLFSVVLVIVLKNTSHTKIFSAMRYQVLDAFVLLCLLAYLCYALVVRCVRYLSHLTVASKILE